MVAFWSVSDGGILVGFYWKQILVALEKLVALESWWLWNLGRSGAGRFRGAGWSDGVNLGRSGGSIFWSVPRGWVGPRMQGGGSVLELVGSVLPWLVKMEGISAALFNAVVNGLCAVVCFL